MNSGRAKGRIVNDLTLAISVALMSHTPNQAMAEITSPFGADIVAFEVADDVLAEARGRYTDRGQLLYFGITLNTQWTTADGTITSGMDIGFNFTKSVQPEQMVQINAYVDSDTGQTTTSGVPISSANSQQAISVGGLEDENVVAQVIEIAGDSNLAVNDSELTVKVINTTDSASTATGGSSSTSNQNASNGVLPNVPQVFANGTIATTIVNDDGVGVIIEVPGGGSAIQMIKGKSTQSAGSGLRQLINIQGDQHRVVNTLGLGAEFAPVASQATRPDLGAALDMVKALPQF